MYIQIFPAESNGGRLGLGLIVLVDSKIKYYYSAYLTPASLFPCRSVAQASVPPKFGQCISGDGRAELFVWWDSSLMRRERLGARSVATNCNPLQRCFSRHTTLHLASSHLTSSHLTTPLADLQRRPPSATFSERRKVWVADAPYII